MRKKHREKPPVFSCDTAINVMELNVVYAMVPCDWDMNDVLEWTVPADDLALLRKVFPITPGAYSYYDIYFPAENDTPIHFRFQPMYVRCASPLDRHWYGAAGSAPDFQPCAKADTILEALRTMHSIRHEFDAIRRTIKWMNDNGATAGWARHYIPALGNLLPAEHAFHQTDGKVFRELYMPPQVREDVRSIAGTISKGLFAGERKLDRTCGYIKIGNGAEWPWFPQP